MNDLCKRGHPIDGLWKTTGKRYCKTCLNTARRLKRSKTHRGAPRSDDVADSRDRDLSKFHDSVDKTDTCWLWNRGLNNGGYGSFYSTELRTSMPAHRYSYTIFKGTIPAGLQIDHLCRVRACVNPDHLEPKTVAENHKAPGSLCHAAKTHCPQGHEYNEENTQVRGGKRYCKTCNRLYGSYAYKQRNKEVVTNA